MAPSSLAQRLALLPEAQRRELLRNVDERAAEELLFRWDFWARPDQLPPSGDWTTWLVLAGRGWGKTRTAAEWVRSIACGPTPLAKGQCSRIAVVAETAADARDVLVEGDSGLLAVHPRGFRPLYEPSKRRLTWPNGAMATLFNAVEPDQLRGPQHDAAVLDELCKWRYAQETWDMLQFGMRLGDRPRQVITTTPRPLPLLRAVMEAPGTVVTRGSTMDNRANLARSFIAQVQDRYAGTRLGRQELDGEILDDVPGAMWTRRLLDEHRRRVTDELPAMQRVVVAIDPAAKESGEADETSETGVIVAGLGVDGRGYVLDDRSCRLPPAGWARLAVANVDYYEADYIVAEVNQGGDMVEAVIKAVRSTIKVRKVRASRGKVTRAEPVSALYEQGRISHVGAFPALEDQMVLFTPFGIAGDGAADRVDALVWALSELFPSIVAHAAPKRAKIECYRGSDNRSKTTGY